MVNKLTAMKNVLEQMRMYQNLLEELSEAAAEEFGLEGSVMDEEGYRPMTIMSILGQQVRLGEDYTKAFYPKGDSGAFKIAIDPEAPTEGFLKNHPMLKSRRELDESV